MEVLYSFSLCRGKFFALVVCVHADPLTFSLGLSLVRHKFRKGGWGPEGYGIYFKANESGQLL